MSDKDRKKMTYKQAGVDIEAADRFVEKIKSLTQSAPQKGVMQGVGLFASIFDPSVFGMEDPVIVSGTDGVGTKLNIAFQANVHNTVGIDLVAMCVNDVITTGAHPAFFLDYLAVGNLQTVDGEKILHGIVEGCRQGEMALVGGETAELPGFYPDGHYELCGFCVGIVDRKKIITGENICAGDILLGLPSNGLHSNGFSLVRKVLLEVRKHSLEAVIPELGGKLQEELLRPTRIYVKEVMGVLEKFPLKGIAHITGGGIAGNVSRLLPKSVDARIKKDAFPCLPVFSFVQKEGGIGEDEMYRTFNMGLGLVMIVSADVADKVQDLLAGMAGDVFRIGQVVPGEGRVTFEGDL